MELLLQAERYMDMGLVEQADAIYRGLAASDPQNAVAVAGMSRVEIERGHDREAYALAVRALAIDPENNVARRLEARLFEVLAARGEPVDRPFDAVTRAAASTAGPQTHPSAAAAGIPGSGTNQEPGRPGAVADAAVERRGAVADAPVERRGDAEDADLTTAGADRPASGPSWLRRILRRR